MAVASAVISEALLAACRRLAAGQKVAVQSPVPANQDTTPQYAWQQPAAALASDSAGWQ